MNAEAADYFRQPKLQSIPALQLGRSIAFLTTTASMVAVINNIVAGAGIALFARWALGVHRTIFAVLIGVACVVVLTAVFLAYQRWRFTMFEPVEA